MPQKLTFFLSEKGSILIVTLIGPLVKDNALAFEECLQEVARSGASVIIMNFRDVSETMDPSFGPAIARLKKAVYERKARLRMSGIHPALRIQMAQAGVLRLEEICDNLSQALQVATAEEIETVSEKPTSS
ncbi:MAG: STAS domain-containing protein [Oligoflexia bacterium]|nr:STAS domain-containing protein [Oligoflexia bacterium]